MEYEAVIGMEVHVELSTLSKMFCGCDAHPFGAAPDTNVCPVCLGMPGVLPVINEKAVEYTILTGLALNCQIQAFNVFARKNYFYPDLPKGYQISQYELPLCRDGFVEIEVEGRKQRVGITRVHLEEDTGKLMHVNGKSLVDLNRAGVPLMEIVTEPDLRSADDAHAYVSLLRQIVRYLGVSSGDMEKGAMRCEVNLSLRPRGSSAFGTKVEIKNLNSFRSVRSAVAYEIERQKEILNSGGRVIQVTMGWDENAGVTREQRSKESAHDYRYFPEPDLPPLRLDETYIETLRHSLPELPGAKVERYVAGWGIKRDDAKALAEDRDVAAYFESVVAAGEGKVPPQSIANWMTGEIFRLLNETGLPISQTRVHPQGLVELIEQLNARTINQTAAKEVLNVMWQSGQRPLEIIAERGLKQISNADALQGTVKQVIQENQDAIEQYRGGKETVLKFLIGQVMRATRGKANPQLVEELLREQLGRPAQLSEAATQEITLQEPRMSDEFNPFRIAQEQLDEAAQILGLDTATYELLRWPRRELVVTIPVQMDDGAIRIFHGYRVQYNDARGPSKGGVRWHPDETIDTVRALAAWMTWKTSVADIPLGGATGGVTCNPKELSLFEQERLARGYIRAIHRMIDEETDIPAPDVYTNSQIMAWMMDEFSIIRGHNVPGAITGKPLELGGSPGRNEATGLGGVYNIREATRVLGMETEGASAAIQGYGNAGLHAHQLGEEILGLKVVAVSDSKGGIYNPNGLKFSEVSRFKRDHGTVVGFPDADAISTEELMLLPVDILIPAALENVITDRNAPRIKARIIAELANGPTTPEADRILHENGIYVIPDLLCNAGGVTVSYFELVQNASDYYWTLEEVYHRLDLRITAAFHTVHQMAQLQNVHNRLAAYLVAVQRVAEACKLRGWV